MAPRSRVQQYEQAFCDNAIDAAVLPSLTAEDLKDLGVNLVGHRRLLLDAIAALSAEKLAVADLPARADAERRRSPRPFRAGLWLVHRGFRYTRSQRGESAARRSQYITDYALAVRREPPAMLHLT
jgi:hypothetical protein